MAAVTFCKVKIRIDWNAGFPEFHVDGPFLAREALDEAATMYAERITDAARAARAKFPTRVNVELYDFQAEETVR